MQLKKSFIFYIKYHSFPIVNWKILAFNCYVDAKYHMDTPQ